MTAVLTDVYIDGWAQDCSNSSALALELLQSCAQTSIYHSAWMRQSFINELLYISVFENVYARSRYQGQGQVITNYLSPPLIPASGTQVLRMGSLTYIYYVCECKMFNITTLDVFPVLLNKYRSRACLRWVPCPHTPADNYTQRPHPHPHPSTIPTATTQYKTASS